MRAPGPYFGCMNTTLAPDDLDPRRQALLLYFQGYRIARIAEMLGEKPATVHSWKKRDKWGDYGPLDQMQLTTAARYCQLIMKEQKEGKDFKEIDLLARQSERHARIGKFSGGGNEADLNPKVANRNSGQRKPPEKNVFTDEQIEKLGKRGVRLDERSEGHGMGIAIAFEILRLNRGNMQMGRSALGGLSVKMNFVAKGRAPSEGAPSHHQA